MKIQQQVRARVDGFGLLARHFQVFGWEVLLGILAVRQVEDEFPAQSMSVSAFAKNFQRVLLPLLASLGSESLQPVHLVTQTLQSEDVLHINPEMAGAIRVTRDIER